MNSNNIILLHAALGSREQLKAIEIELSKKYNVLSMDFEGHGAWQSENDFSINRFTENVRDFLNEKKIKKTHIFGYSMGGYVGLNLALQYPDLVESVVTFGTKFDWNPKSAETEVKMLNPEIIEIKVPKFAAYLKKLHTNNDWKNVLNKTASLMLDLGSNPLLNDVSLAKIEQPVLITVGDQDHMITEKESSLAADTIKFGNLEILNGYQHAIERNDNIDLLNLIDQHIAKISND